MATGGIFTLIADDGKADRLIMAPELLKTRIANIMRRRLAEKCDEDPTPTLMDIERTHLLFVNAHFKPFAAMAYEYQKTNPQSGNVILNSQIIFSIPQLGDFFNDMVVHTQLSSFSSTAGVCPAVPADTSTGAGTALDPQINTTYRYVDAAGNTVTPGAAVNDFVRYVKYPGARIFDKTDFTVNGNPLDSYNYNAYVFEKNCFINKDDVGYKRCMGQEIPVEAHSYLTSVSGVGGKTDTCRRLGYIANGPQTPKATQPALDLWIPLLFWFNKDVRLSIPSVAIPFGQRFISINLTAAANLVKLAYGGLFLEKTTMNLVIDTGVIQSTDTTIELSPVMSVGGAVGAPTINTMELYINNIFMSPEIHDIYIRRIGFSLIRVHREQTSQKNTASDDVLMSNLKWPIEYMFIGLRPTENESDPDMWYRFTYATNHTTEISSFSTVPAADDQSATGGNRYKAKSTVESLNYKIYQRTMDTLKITAHGVALYAETPAEFFNSYIPHMYGQNNVMPPVDTGVMFVTFCLYPGTYQPSGHINVSRAREFYVYYTSTLLPNVVSSANLIVLASAINFLLISDGTAVLRYTT